MLLVYKVFGELCKVHGQIPCAKQQKAGDNWLTSWPSGSQRRKGTGRQRIRGGGGGA